MRKKCFIALLVVLCLVCSVVLGMTFQYADSITENTDTMDEMTLSEELEKISEISQETVELEETDSFKRMISVIEENRSDEYEDYYNDVIHNYFYLKKVHGLSQNELDYISDLISTGCDADLILDLAYFWLDTSEDITLIEKMYNVKDRYEGRVTWYENAFCYVTGYDNDLTDEEFEYYSEKGITREIIDIADKIARRRVYTTKEILEKVANGENITEIAYEVENSKNKKFRNARKSIKNEKLINHKNIEKSKRLAELTENYDEVFVDLSEEELNKKLETAEKAVSKSIQSSMKKQKLFKNNPDRKNEKIFKEKIKAKGVSEEEIEKYVNEGLKYVDILNAAEYKEENNTTLEEAVKEVAVNE